MLKHETQNPLENSEALIFSTGLQASPGTQQPRKVRRPSMEANAALSVNVQAEEYHRSPLNSKGSFCSSETLYSIALADAEPLCSPRYRRSLTSSFASLGSFRCQFGVDDLFCWDVPLDADDENTQSEEAYSTRFRNDYLRHVDNVRKKHKLFIAVRLQNDPFIPSNRRYSFLH